MAKYILKRMLALIPVIFGVTLVVFLIMQMAPGDPARMIAGEMASQEQVDELREEMGLNDPVLLRYFNYMADFFRGDLGESYFKHRPVMDEIMDRFPYTAKLAGTAVILTVIMSIPIGILAAVKQNTIFDNLSLVVTLFGISMPVFWLGLLLSSLVCCRQEVQKAGEAISFRPSAWHSAICQPLQGRRGLPCWKPSARTMCGRQGQKELPRRRSSESMRSETP